MNLSRPGRLVGDEDRTAGDCRDFGGDWELVFDDGSETSIVT